MKYFNLNYSGEFTVIPVVLYTVAGGYYTQNVDGYFGADLIYLPTAAVYGLTDYMSL